MSGTMSAVHRKKTDPPSFPGRLSTLSPDLDEGIQIVSMGHC